MTDVLAILGGILFLGLIAYGIWAIITWRKLRDPKEPWEKTGPGVGPGRPKGSTRVYRGPPGDSAHPRRGARMRGRRPDRGC